MSNDSQGSVSSLGPQDPKGPQDGEILEFEAKMIDANVVNVELPQPGDIQSRLQHALAALCLRHKLSETIEPRMLRVFLDTVTPKQHAISPKDMVLAMLTHKQFEIPILTTRYTVGKTTASKHETSYGIQYRNLCIVGPDPKYNTEHTFAEEADERLRDHYKFLKSVLSTHPEPIFRDLKWSQSDVLSCFKDAKVKKRSKEIITCNVRFPPLSFIHIPFDVLRVVINDAFCEAPHATIHSALKATISGTHVTEVMGETQGWRVWDQAPSGVWEKVVTPTEGEVFRTAVQPTYHPHGPLWGIEYSLAPAPKPNQSTPKRAKMSVIDSRLQAKGEQSTPPATG